MKYQISINTIKVIYADDEEDALEQFWDKTDVDQLVDIKKIKKEKK